MNQEINEESHKENIKEISKENIKEVSKENNKELSKEINGYYVDQNCNTNYTKKENDNFIENNTIKQNDKSIEKSETKYCKTKLVKKENTVVMQKEEEGEGLMEIWMHQAIETIEFSVGLVSNTSSYLRLWAISLAHSQLTQVLHSLTLDCSIMYYPITVPFWFLFTIALLLGLEGLSSVLHALRLNWIEFNGKFFKGEGENFIPLNFEVYDDD
ncbi:H(+)-transporting V0 sector ATPase subunit a [Gurleya vavrai]